MAYVVTSPCIGTKDAACTKVCPCNCFFDAGEMLVINPDECIDCALCVPECPVSAIFHDDDMPASEASFIERNRAFFTGKSAEDLEKVHITP